MPHSSVGPPLMLNLILTTSPKAERSHAVHVLVMAPFLAKVMLTVFSSAPEASYPVA